MGDMTFSWQSLLFAALIILLSVPSQMAFTPRLGPLVHTLA
jgi:hypothetical protein